MTLVDLVIVLCVLLVAGAGVHLVQVYWPHADRQEHNDVAGFIFAAVGVLYAVLLAFVVIVVWENLNAARDTTYSEANQLADIYWISRSLPVAEGATIEGLTLKYAHTVITQEWPLMAERRSSIQATDIVYLIRDDVFGFQPRSPQQQALYAEALTSVNGFSSARRNRLDAIGEVIPALLWAALIIGAVMTVGFCLLFGLQNKTAHIGMVAMLAVLITISLLLIRDMEYPFAGSIRIGPAAFEVFLSHLPPPR
ncbi:MAG TPA: DUF4239 domain-containing protein [Streptosporangiaceae bacterium]|nr:DUF4239 domain-containing protein [Streptosporangiaceae bacterium]